MCKRLRTIALTAGLTMILCLGGCGQKGEPVDAGVATESVAESETDSKEETDKLSKHLEGLADVYIEVGSTKVDYLDGLKYDKKVITGIEVDDSKVNTKQAGVYTLRYILSGQRVNGKITKETVKSKVFVVKKDDAQKLADAGVAVETDKGTKKNSKGEEVVRVVSTQNGSNAVSGGSGSKPSGGSSNTGSNSSTRPSGSGNNSSSTKPSGGSGSNNNSGTKPSGGNSNNSTKPSGGSGSSGGNSSTKPSGGGNTGSTKPSGGNGGSSNTKPAETNPPKPAETEPPQTQPPQTNPPQTNPPETEPPHTNPPETNPPETEPKGEWVHYKEPIYKTVCYSICNGCGQDITGFETEHGYQGMLDGTPCGNGFWSKYEQEFTGEYKEWDEWVEY